MYKKVLQNGTFRTKGLGTSLGETQLFMSLRRRVVVTLSSGKSGSINSREIKLFQFAIDLQGT